MPASYGFPTVLQYSRLTNIAADLKSRAEEIDRTRAANRPTVPSLLGEEKRTNPFLRADDPGLAAVLDMTGRDATAVFAEIRSRKDNF